MPKFRIQNFSKCPYLIQGLAKPVAVVGDAMFAGSMGGGTVSYADTLRNNREQILTLPDTTIICPGHGPLTTVGEQNTQIPSSPLKNQ
jgi:hydroxyacylglutathione hydrolase